jgi:hypothetical protein
VRVYGAILGLLLATQSVAAQETVQKPKPFPISLHGSLYEADLDLRDMMTPAVLEKFNSGVTARLLLRASVIDADNGSVRSLSVTEYRIRYRVWDEEFVVRIWSPLGKESVQRFKDQTALLSRVAQQPHLPVAGAGDLVAGRRYFAVVEVEVDPVSEELLAKVREYLANPGGHRREGGGRGLFGNLARIFFDPQTGSNPNAIEFRSELFTAKDVK